MISARQHFKLFWDIPPHTLTDIDRAVRFYYLQRLGFGGQITTKCFGVTADRSSRFNPARIKGDIDTLAKRLSAVTIENLDFGEFIERYYGKTDFKRLAKLLKDIKGKFLLNLDDTPEIRDIFKGFDFESVRTTYSINMNKNTDAKEVIISN